ncbi:hypothetical protein ACLMJK_007828 [Lecanora helva]
MALAGLARRPSTIQKVLPLCVNRTLPRLPHRPSRHASNARVQQSSWPGCGLVIFSAFAIGLTAFLSPQRSDDVKTITLNPERDEIKDSKDFQRMRDELDIASWKAAYIESPDSDIVDGEELKFVVHASGAHSPIMDFTITIKATSLHRQWGDNRQPLPAGFLINLPPDMENSKGVAAWILKHIMRWRELNGGLAMADSGICISICNTEAVVWRYQRGCMSEVGSLTI